MKLKIAVVAVLVVATVALVLYWRFESEREERRRIAQMQSDRINMEFQIKVQQEMLALDIQHVRLVFGESAAATYELCHKYQPSTAKHQAECAALDRRLAKDREKQSKNPW